jgi:hypothetical protein
MLARLANFAALVFFCLSAVFWMLGYNDQSQGAMIAGLILLTQSFVYPE